MDILNVKTQMYKTEIVDEVAEIFKILGDSTRVKILNVLQIQELCVGDICLCVDMTKSAVSHQLRILKQAKLVKGRKSGKEVFYSLDDDHIDLIFQCAMEHVIE